MFRKCAVLRHNNALFIPRLLLHVFYFSNTKLKQTLLWFVCCFSWDWIGLSISPICAYHLKHCLNELLSGYQKKKLFSYMQIWYLGKHIQKCFTSYKVRKHIYSYIYKRTFFSSLFLAAFHKIVRLILHYLSKCQFFMHLSAFVTLIHK